MRDEKWKTKKQNLLFLEAQKKHLKILIIQKIKEKKTVIIEKKITSKQSFKGSFNKTTLTKPLSGGFKRPTSTKPNIFSKTSTNTSDFERRKLAEQRATKRLKGGNEGKDKNGLSFPYVTCAITGKKHSVMEAQAHPLSMNLDHEIPVARGGRNELENCQPLGTAINQIKGDRTNEELFDILFDIFRADPFINYVEKVKKCKILIKNK